jgi:hypothetical protein
MRPAHFDRAELFPLRIQWQVRERVTSDGIMQWHEGIAEAGEDCLIALNEGQGDFHGNHTGRVTTKGPQGTGRGAGILASI